MSSFLITGLPRCRTAWMAAVTTGERSICHHEPLNQMKHWRDVYDLWGRQEREYVGISDSCLGFHLGEILDVEGPRTLIINRPIPDVEASLIAAGLPITTNYCELLSDFIRPFRSHPLVMNVTFEALSSIQVVLTCLEHLMPDLEPDEERVAELMDVNIQVDARAAMIDAISHPVDLSALLGQAVLMGLRFR